MIHTSSTPSIWRDWRLFLAFGCGSGASPVAPGTMGSLFAWLIFMLLPAFSLVAWFCIFIVFIPFSIYLADYAEKITKQKDHSGIVCDEIVGLWLAASLVPCQFSWLLITFILFRFFDIAKPWPINRLQSLPGGLGIVADDILAGIYSGLLVQLCVFLFK